MNSFQNVFFIFAEYHILIIFVFKYFRIVNICVWRLIYKWHLFYIFVLVKYIFFIINWACLIFLFIIVKNLILLIFIWQWIFEVWRIKIYLCKLVNYSKNENIRRILKNIFEVNQLFILIFTFLVCFKT